MHMHTPKTTQYTLRNIPDRVDHRLREAAAQYGASLNQTAVEALARGLGMDEAPIVHHDLDDLAGTWVKDPAFDQAVKAMDRVDKDLWS